ncbi:hypothetical protein ACFO1B_28000 [Dactylosporangium siamense]|uniref:hypothetical protein n=1 Tax=Dactylosporangium siamense TaxID=685454 RepID=UPI00194110CC|nr:hypothetical protein [Dactylosporangium siamense]
MKRVEELLNLRGHQDLPLHSRTSTVNNIINIKHRSARQGIGAGMAAEDAGVRLPAAVSRHRSVAGTGRRGRCRRTHLEATHKEPAQDVDGCRRVATTGLVKSPRVLRKLEGEPGAWDR